MQRKNVAHKGFLMRSVIIGDAAFLLALWASNDAILQLDTNLLLIISGAVLFSSLSAAFVIQNLPERNDRRELKAKGSKIDNQNQTGINNDD